MRRIAWLAGLTALLAAAAGAAYQAAAQVREYRFLLLEGDRAAALDQVFAAIEAYSGAIALREGSMLPYLRRGEMYRRHGSLDAAARDFRSAVERDPSATQALEAWADVLYEQHRYDRAAEIYDRRLRLEATSLGATYKLALSLYRLGSLDAALSTLERAIELDSLRAEPYYLRGLCLRDQGHEAAAAAAFEASVARAPGLALAREELADLYRALGRPVDEIAQLQILADLDRSRIERQVAVGVAHARAAREASDPATRDRHVNLAVLTLGHALERASDASVVYGALGQVWLDSAVADNDRVDLKKAIEALERIALLPGAPSEWITSYGLALVRDNQFAAAERILQRATESYPVDLRALPEYAAVAERNGHLDTARSALVKFAALASQGRDAGERAMKIGALSLRLGDPGTAVVWLERALLGEPGDVGMLTLLADAQLQAGAAESARATVTRGLALDPGNSRLIQLSRRISL
jgi:tetratricopeptide (TPR) repeat protein